VNLNRIFVASLRLCGEPLCSYPTTETQRVIEVGAKEMGIPRGRLNRHQFQNSKFIYQAVHGDLLRLNYYG